MYYNYYQCFKLISRFIHNETHFNVNHFYNEFIITKYSRLTEFKNLKVDHVNFHFTFVIQ